ncbi:hypothetical protein HZA99_06240 [Candidatus Woesearchaeota archaeon]|nr:hypothetical protein [Candidatus Woesearchaeota archaeon]
MKLRNFSRFSLAMFSLFFVSVASASAALPQTFNNVLRIIAQPLQVLFVVLPASSAFPYLLKFLYFIILAALWSGIASQITKDREGGVKRAFKIFGVIVALVSAIFIPQSWLMYAFKIPAMISIVLFFLVVPLGGFFLCNKLITGDTRAARLGRAFIWWVIALLVLAMVEFIQKHPDPALQQMISPVLDALNIGAVVALFAGLYNLAMGLGAGTAAEAGWNAIRRAPPPAGPPPAGPPHGPAPPGPPGPAPPGAHPAHPRNPAIVQALERQMADFYNRVLMGPNSINSTVTGIVTDFQIDLAAAIPPGTIPGGARRLTRTVISGLPPAVLTAIRTGPVAAAAAEIAAFQPRDVVPARTLMETIFNTAHTSHQYEHITPTVMHNFEHAVAEFLNSESEIGQFIAFISAI